MTSLLTEDCSRFLPPQHRTLDHRLFEDVSVAQQEPPMTQNANVVDLKDRRHGAGCHSDTSVLVLTPQTMRAISENFDLHNKHLHGEQWRPWLSHRVHIHTLCNTAQKRHHTGRREAILYMGTTIWAHWRNDYNNHLACQSLDMSVNVVHRVDTHKLCYTTQNRHPVGRHGSKLAQGHNGTTYWAY